MTPPSQKVNLGLDLQGGMHVVLQVKTDTAVEAKLNIMESQLKKELQQKGIAFSYTQKNADNGFNIKFNNPADEAEIEKTAKLFGLEPKSRSEGNLTFSLSEKDIDDIKDSAVLQSLEIIRNRVDAFGVSEPLIQRQGEDSILVQLPGVTDPERALNLIGKTAQLKFYLVNENVNKDSLKNNVVPFGTIILNEKITDASGKVVQTIPYALRDRVAMTGDSIADANVRFDQYGQPYISFSLDPLGARIFEDITAANEGKQLAIVLDDTVYSAPVINEKISGGEGMISGRFTLEQAKDLAIVLRAGSMPAEVELAEQRTVGPSLGADSIRSGIKASLIGISLICIFMIIYYRLSGVVAIIGLICNFIVLFGSLCFIKATLTMPGIAGIILTLGIAVDANVLIFERIREELRSGRSVMNAFELGYQKAFATILDSNITSLIAALVLFQFGTGPIKGFAVTLSLGLIASMFTAVFVTKTVLMEFVIRKNTKSISI